jgi:hypothetical protein
MKSWKPYQDNRYTLKNRTKNLPNTNHKLYHLCRPTPYRTVNFLISTRQGINLPRLSSPAQDKDRWRALVHLVTNLRVFGFVSWLAENLSASQAGLYSMKYYPPPPPPSRKEIGIQVLTGTTDFSLLWSVRTGLGDPPNGYWVNFQRGRRAEALRWPHPSSAVLLKHKDIFTVLLVKKASRLNPKHAVFLINPDFLPL